jgi:hypothetical protein
MSLAAEIDVARPKSKPKAEPPPDPGGRKPLVIQVRGGTEWKLWVERLSDFDGIPLAMLVDRALRVYARQIGFEEAPPKR